MKYILVAFLSAGAVALFAVLLFKHQAQAPAQPAPATVANEQTPNSECGQINPQSLIPIGGMLGGLGEDQRICVYDVYTKMWRVPTITEVPETATTTQK